ncbi:AAA family ATPase [Nocardia cyriacigeorgica]|uniref:ATPase n=1 Tax=Nocardia cyriacigeorgica TaxID=135487 RepID=A0A5R8NJL9_9NOCA|nr:AAA family ATPase [Nocardia cyriacigeorgica]TLF75880.1 ATPase [Nocardia cyriacigeorgica]
MTTTESHLLRPHAEQAFAGELRALAAVDDRPRPPSWRLSPWAVVTYLLGGTLDDGTVISPKYVGPRRLMEVAVATLATDRALRTGAIARIEELTRIPSDVQDALITVLSEKTLPIPELGAEVQAAKGFNVIATANDRDRGVNELSSALRRRFNTVVLPLPASEEDEVAIVTRRVAQLGSALELPEVPAAADEVRRVVRIFRELRDGITADGRTKLKSPSGTLSTAEAISVITSGLALSAHFGDGVLRAGDVAGAVLGSVIKDPVADAVVWTEYLEAVVRERPEWSDFYRACREVGG